MMAKFGKTLLRVLSIVVAVLLIILGIMYFLGVKIYSQWFIVLLCALIVLTVIRKSVDKT